MHQFKELLWIAWAIQLIRPIIPTTAFLISSASSRYQKPSWIQQLTIIVIFTLLIDWALLGLAYCHIHNAWLANLAILPELLLYLWILPKINQQFHFPSMPVALIAIALSVVFCIWDWFRLGLWAKWPMGWTFTSFIIFIVCIWKFKEILIKSHNESLFYRPEFWFLGASTLRYGTLLIFHPLGSVFLKSLPADLILIPGLFVYLIQLFMDIILSKTFLCQKQTLY
ncbi:hypothetical protein GETHPA_08550 [Geothrix rubra]|uniref:Uncharacterized protein n=1 Tax=Geothrix rubra TaxID=2927977 RepID=A0ABQ5Q3K5_9BACT|nr:hypothetical protein GETHPA_08550 [Geothrix rubra]